MTKKTIFDKSVAGRAGCLPAAPTKSAKDMLPAGLLTAARYLHRPRTISVIRSAASGTASDFMASALRSSRFAWNI